MSIVERMLEYRRTGNVKLLMSSDLEIDNENLSVIVIEILSWLKLENKRKIWMQQGKKTCLKPLNINMHYPWCVDLCKLIEKEKVFYDNFSIKDGKLDFSDSVTEQEREIARELAYENYNPQMNT